MTGKTSGGRLRREVTGDPAETGGDAVRLPGGLRGGVLSDGAGVASDGTHDYLLTGWEIGGGPGEPYAPQATMTAGLDVAAMAEYTRLGDFDKDGDVDFWDFMFFVDVYGT